MDATASARSASVFSPLARAVMDAFREGVVVFDPSGRRIYANQAARERADELLSGGEQTSHRLLPELAKLGARLAPLRVGKLTVGEAAYLPKKERERSLAQQERRAILEALHATSWRLTEAANRLGISRTTLWRRLRRYGVKSEQRPWAAPQELGAAAGMLASGLEKMTNRGAARGE